MNNSPNLKLITSNDPDEDTFYYFVKEAPFLYGSTSETKSLSINLYYIIGPNETCDLHENPRDLGRKLKKLYDAVNNGEGIYDVELPLNIIHDIPAAYHPLSTEYNPEMDPNSTHLYRRLDSEEINEVRTITEKGILRLV